MQKLPHPADKHDHQDYPEQRKADLAHNTAELKTVGHAYVLYVTYFKPAEYIYLLARRHAGHNQDLYHLVYNHKQDTCNQQDPASGYYCVLSSFHFGKVSPLPLR